MTEFRYPLAADHKALKVASYLTIYPNATLKQIASHFNKSTFWAKTYKDRALSGNTYWQWLTPRNWHKGDLVYTIDHILKVREIGRSDKNIWCYTIIRGRPRGLQVFSEFSSRAWPTIRKEDIRKP